MNFRVNNTPCRVKGTADLNSRDLVTVVSKRSGELNVLVLVNETNNLDMKQIMVPLQKI